MLQQSGESAVDAQRVKKRLDSYQIDEVRFLLNRFFQAVECEIVVSSADSPEGLCQRWDVSTAMVFTGRESRN